MGHPDIQSIATDLHLGDDGIWYSSGHSAVAYPSDASEACFLVEDRSIWFLHRNRCITTVVGRFPPEKSGTIFDIGGGNGFVALALAQAGFDVAVVEPSRAGAKNAQERGLPCVICSTLEGAGFRDESLPAVGLFDVVEHIEDDLTFLRSIRQMMTSGGRIYATVPAYPALWSESDVKAGHFRRYTLQEVRSLFEGAGFSVDYSTHIFGLLPIPILLFRTIPSRLGLAKSENKPQDITREHGISGGVVSRLFSTVLKPEVGLLERGQTIGFGGSCLIVGTVG
jgi:SAM-dependent methyltransferase